jgi:hypothetical protein
MRRIATSPSTLRHLYVPPAEHKAVHSKNRAELVAVT